LLKQSNRAIISNITVCKLQLQEFLTVFLDLPRDTLRTCIADRRVTHVYRVHFLLGYLTDVALDLSLKFLIYVFVLG
jgi:hypothetical protein